MVLDERNQKNRGSAGRILESFSFWQIFSFLLYVLSDWDSRISSKTYKHEKSPLQHILHSQPLKHVVTLFLLHNPTYPHSNAITSIPITHPITPTHYHYPAPTPAATLQPSTSFPDERHHSHLPSPIWPRHSQIQRPKGPPYTTCPLIQQVTAPKLKARVPYDLRPYTSDDAK